MILPTNNFAFQVEEDLYNKIWIQIWKLVPNEYKISESLADFRAKIKT